MTDHGLTDMNKATRRFAEAHRESIEGHILRAIAHGHDRLAVYSAVRPMAPDRGRGWGHYQFDYQVAMYDAEWYPYQQAPPAPDGYKTSEVHDLGGWTVPQVREMMHGDY